MNRRVAELDIDESWLTKRRAVLAFRKENGYTCHVGIRKTASDREHGIASYKKGCRCDDCRVARRDYARRYRLRRIGATT